MSRGKRNERSIETNRPPDPLGFGALDDLKDVPALKTKYAYEVRKGVPIPGFRRGRVQKSTKYPFEAMQVGDSFFIPGKKPTAMGGLIYAFRVKHPDWRFACRSVEENGVKGCAIWRVK